LQITFSNARDNCLSVDIVSVEELCTTLKLLFLLSLVWLTESALNIKKSRSVKNQNTELFYWPVNKRTLKLIKCSTDLCLQQIAKSKQAKNFSTFDLLF